MIRGIFTALSLVGTVLFPWPFTVVLAVVTSFFEPLVPLAVGLLADILFYSSHAARLPLFTLGGAAVSVLALFVRSQLNTGIIVG